MIEYKPGEVMKKSFIVTLIKRTKNCVQYESPVFQTIYIKKSVLPNIVPKAIKITIEVEQ